MEILDENSKVLDTTDEQVNLLRMLWDANEAVFEAAIYHLYKEQHQAALDKIFKSSSKDDGKYTVSHNGKAIFPGKCLSKAMCVKIWRKGDFDRLISYVHAKGYDEFIKIKEC